MNHPHTTLERCGVVAPAKAERAGADDGMTGFIGDSDTARIVGSRRTRLYLLPHSGAAVIAEIFPAQMLQGAMEEKKWVQVAYTDFASQSHREGWILKKYAPRVVKKRAADKGGSRARQYHLALLAADAASTADLRAGRFTRETAAEHILWLESQR